MKEDLTTPIDEVCWYCSERLDSYVYSPSIYFKDGTQECIDEIISDMTDKDMIDYEDKIKEERDNVDYLGFGKFCPHCLNSVN